MAIVHPLKHRMSRKRARLALCVIWLASSLLALPCIIYSTTRTKQYSNGQTEVICYIVWPDGTYPKSVTDYVYNLIILGTTYVVPMTAIAVCYTRMGRELWGSHSIGEMTQRQIEAVRSKKKVVRMFIIVVVIFGLCWLPYHMHFVYAYHNNEFASTAYVQHMYLAFYWLAMSNTMVNPIIYYWMNHRFRMYFQQIICQCRCFCRRKRHDAFELNSLKQNTHSDLHRSRSARNNTAAVRQRSESCRWHHQTQESQLCQIPFDRVGNHTHQGEAQEQRNDIKQSV